jgi:hypothetical protein
MKLLGGPGGVWRTRDGAETWHAKAFLADTCSPCNAAMNRLYENHDRARRVLSPLLVGAPTTLGGKEQRFVADWLIKTSLMIRAAIPHDQRPALLRYFHDQDFRLPGAVVWVAKYEPFMVQALHSPLNTNAPPRPPQPRVRASEAAPRKPAPIGSPPLGFPYLLNNAPLTYAEPTAVGALGFFVAHSARLPVAFYAALDRMMFRLPGRGAVSWDDLPLMTAELWADIDASIVWSGPPAL